MKIINANNNEELLQASMQAAMKTGQLIPAVFNKGQNAVIETCDNCLIICAKVNDRVAAVVKLHMDTPVKLITDFPLVNEPPTAQEKIQSLMEDWAANAEELISLKNEMTAEQLHTLNADILKLNFELEMVMLKRERAQIFKESVLDLSTFFDSDEEE